MNRKYFILLLISALSSFFVYSVQGSFRPLQVSVLVNGFSVPAIIDTGAEVSVMSLSCAKRCKLADAIDTRHSGTAVGVGVTDIVGRIDGLELKLGETASISNEISVLRQSKCDFILGLDVLQKHNCDISFKDNRLRMTVKNKTVKIPLLSTIAVSYEAESIAASPSQQPKKRVKSFAKVEEPQEAEDTEEGEQEENGEAEPISMAGV